MKIITFSFLLPVMFLVNISCKSRDTSASRDAAAPRYAEMSMVEAKNAPPPPPAADIQDMPLDRTAGKDVQKPETTGPAVSRKIIKDGRMELRVNKLEQGKIQIDSLVNKFHGYYAEETFNNQDFSHDFTLKIRIPSDKFELFISQAESAVGELVYKNVSSRDVTEEYIDLDTRLKNKKNYLNRYGELLKKATSVKDILDIEEKTRGIEEEIESTEGRLKYLNNQVDFSTLELSITKKNDYNFIPRNEGSFVDRLRFSLVKGWYGLVTFTLFVIRIWPFWIIVALISVMIRKILKRRKGK
jgi:hypothetical protein